MAHRDARDARDGRRFFCAPGIHAPDSRHPLEGEDVRRKLFACPTNNASANYLTRDEVASLLRAAQKSPRYGARNHAMILIAYRHGLRASELVNLRVSDLDLASGTIYCRRA